MSEAGSCGHAVVWRRPARSARRPTGSGSASGWIGWPVVVRPTTSSTRTCGEHPRTVRAFVGIRWLLLGETVVGLTAVFIAAVLASRGEHVPWAVWFRSTVVLLHHLHPLRLRVARPARLLLGLRAAAALQPHLPDRHAHRRDHPRALPVLDGRRADRLLVAHDRHRRPAHLRPHASHVPPTGQARDGRVVGASARRCFDD